MKTLLLIVRRFLGTVLLFPLLVALGTSTTLLVASCIGYLSYSDRPGPGWYGPRHWPTWQEILTYFGFAPWFAYFCLFFGLGLLGLSLILSFASSPKWLNRILGGVFSLLSAGLAVMGAGWYIALSSLGAYASLLFGLIYGVFVFPVFTRPWRMHVRPWIKVSAVLVTIAAFSFWLVSPFLPKTPQPGIQYDVVRVTPSEKPLQVSSFLGDTVLQGIQQLKIRGDVHGGIGGSVSGTDSQDSKIDVELIALEPIKKKARLAIPKSGYVIYTLQKGIWTPHPQFQDKDGRQLTIEPGTNAQHDGGKMTIDKAPGTSDFTWYPVISKGS